MCLKTQIIDVINVLKHAEGVFQFRAFHLLQGWSGTGDGRVSIFKSGLSSWNVEMEMYSSM